MRSVPKNPILRVLVSVCLGLFLVASATGCQGAKAFHGDLVDSAETPELAGTNWTGEPFRLSETRGQVSVVFFGYTFCPDVCPFTLAKMKQLYRRLGERSDQVNVVFVSVDPERDTVEKIAGYVPGFDERFYGVSPDDLDRTTEAFGVTVQRGPREGGPGTNGYYYVDHTGTYFVVDRQGRLRLKFPPDATVDAMYADIERLLEG